MFYRALFYFFLPQLMLQTSIYPLMYEYEADPVNEMVYSPCKEYPNNFIDKWIDISKINFTFRPDGLINIAGPLVIVTDFEDKKLVKFTGNTYIKKRGSWMSTIYNIKRNNFCAALFNPLEFWYQFTKQILPDNRICPPKMGNAILYTYVLEFLNEKICSPCDTHPAHFIDKWFDLSKINFTFGIDDMIHISGPLEVVAKFASEKPLKLTGNTYKKTRGGWETTMGNMKRSDFCFSLYNPIEYWYQYTKQITNRKCPPKFGALYDFNLSPSNVITLPFRNAEGNYVFRGIVEYGEDRSNFICFDILFYLRKIGK